MPPEINKLTLLYIEDDTEILENVSFLLGRYVKEVFTAEDGEEALAVYEKEKPDIVVTDISIPKINGLEVASKIRENNKTIPIVIISAHQEEDQIQKAQELGISTYVKKPFTLSELRNAMEKAISQY